jgi:putative RNA 2'-phosphotransferase
MAELCQPPELLYHGTAWHLINIITKKEGLKPMGRQMVHLSSDMETAFKVALRKTKKPLIMKIHALSAFNSGICFYYANDTTWLAEEIPPEFIEAM